MTKVVFLSSERANLASKQANQSVYEEFKSFADHDVQKITLDASLSPILKNIGTLTKADRIFIGSYEPIMISAIHILRTDFGIKVPIYFILNGFATILPNIFKSIDEYLLVTDVFVCSSDAEIRVLKLFVQDPKVIKIPFRPVVKKRTLNGSNITNFVYVGRISHQKNLGPLIECFSRLEQCVSQTSVQLTVYGAEDGLGVPEIGLESKNYLQSLKSLETFLSIKNLKWMGFCEQKNLNKDLLSREHVFISPSLHIAENYGLAAYRSLAAGNRAILSDWGGHKELFQMFPEQTTLVPVSILNSSPKLDSRSLYNAMIRSLDMSINDDVFQRRFQDPVSFPQETEERGPMKFTKSYHEIKSSHIKSKGQSPLYSGRHISSYQKICELMAFS